MNVFLTLTDCVAGVMKALKCPFLTRIPIGQVKQHASELLTFADHCPVMGHVMQYSVLSGGETPLMQGRFACADFVTYVEEYVCETVA